MVESIPTVEVRPNRETARVKKLVEAAENVVLFVPRDDSRTHLTENHSGANKPAMVLKRPDDGINERFVVIADARFSALLASPPSSEETADTDSAHVVWTFEPDIVYSALEYLMARMTAEHPVNAGPFADAVRVSMPKATSLQLTLGVTTKLARLLQEQAEREIALNRLATAIRNSLDLNSLLRTAANEVGRALNANLCAVQIEGELVGNTKTESFVSSGSIATDEREDTLTQDIELAKTTLRQTPKAWVIDGDAAQDNGGCAQAAVPLLYQGSYVGLLLVQGDGSRIWADNELLLLHTVADQLTVAVNQAHLFAQLQVQALNDGLTGCYNRRAFEMQLERDLHLATRMQQPLSLIMLDADNFKKINDQSGHDTGDSALQIMAENLRAELRAVDSAARFGGDEFAVILPQADIEGAMLVAERLRKRMAETEIPGYGFMTASFGLATFPMHATSRDTLVVAADRALYHSKTSGRNQVSAPPDPDTDGTFVDTNSYPELETTAEIN
ncbi:MAG TPA: sensor domain-containing diguanylate cyclase [Pyrinomonadaceae bacterium]|nr:sensor domain-containing diguanylate cyclase [Pyrinomonadaceae bacterium]